MVFNLAIRVISIVSKAVLELQDENGQSMFQQLLQTLVSTGSFSSHTSESMTLNQAPLPLRRGQEEELLLHVFIAHAFTAGHLRVRKRTEEAGGCQSQFQSGKVQPNAN